MSLLSGEEISKKTEIAVSVAFLWKLKTSGNGKNYFSENRRASARRAGRKVFSSFEITQ